MINNDTEKNVNVDNWRAFKKAHKISFKTMSNIIKIASEGFSKGHQPWAKGKTRELLLPF